VERASGRMWRLQALVLGLLLGAAIAVPGWSGQAAGEAQSAPAAAILPTGILPATGPLALPAVRDQERLDPGERMTVVIAAPEPAVQVPRSSATVLPVAMSASQPPPVVRAAPGIDPLSLLVLTYHCVGSQPEGADEMARSLTVGPEQFEAHLDLLQSRGYLTVTFRQVCAALAGEEELPARAVAITFDDGYLDNYSTAFPLLRARGMTATFFVATGAMGRPGCMSWDQLREMEEDGMSIQSHTVTHPDLTRISDGRLDAELFDSRRAIAENLGEWPVALSYPGGKCNARVTDRALKAGYSLAVTTVCGTGVDPAHPGLVPRVCPPPWSGLGWLEEVLE
jgi:peptidoglycan/xylan/chitin deacetylase (PgdA/CDA1 family)